MKSFNVYQQFAPVPRKTKDKEGNQEYDSRLVHVGQVQAHSGSHAIDVARDTMPEFKRASRNTLAAYPIVEEV